jgi:hypothetical protein
LAARAILKDNQDQYMQSNISVEYQVLCKDTAFIGVIKQDKKYIGEIRQVVIEQSNIKKQAEVVAKS